MQIVLRNLRKKHLMERIAEFEKNHSTLTVKSNISYSNEVVQIVLLLYLRCALSFAAVERCLTLILSFFLNSSESPSRHTIHLWVIRVGYYTLNSIFPIVSPFVWIIDHVICRGSVKCFMILGIPYNEMPFGQRPLEASDMTLLSLVPMEKSNGDIVKYHLDACMQQYGLPYEILSDEGGDLHVGVRKFVEGQTPYFLFFTCLI